MLVPATKMLDEAARGGYAVAQFNINNLEWTRAILRAGMLSGAPLILGVTGAALKYMGGLRLARAMVVESMENLRVTVPVALHLDHAEEDACLEAIGAGFTSVMFDGSKMPFERNLAICKRLAAICKENNVSLEAELGSPAGEEDGISGSGEKADVAQCAELAASGISCLAASIGNIHGKYPKDWPGLDFALLQKIHAALGNMPLALHGGSGIPDKMVELAIQLGISKINVNTECQQAFARAIAEYCSTGLNEPGGYNWQKLLGPGLDAIMARALEKIRLFGSENQA